MRDRRGEVRLVWRILMAVGIYAAVSILIRFIPIFLSTAVQTARGVDQQEALEAAKALAFEHPIWSTVLGLINAIMSFLLVWFLMRVIEKRSFAWKDVGLDWRRTSLLWLALGALFALLMYVAETVVDHRVLGSSVPTIDALLAAVTVSAVVRNLALWIPMGFSEEVLFRGYVQTRLVERHGAFWGILTGSIVFTLLHLLGRPLSPMTILSAVILWSAIGALYHWSKSLYLVGMFHAVANTQLNVLPSDRSEAAAMTVHVLALLLIVAVGPRMSQCFRATSNPAGGRHPGRTDGDCS